MKHLCILVLLLSWTTLTHLGCKPADAPVVSTATAKQSTPAATPTVATKIPKSSESAVASPALRTDGVWKVKSAMVAGQPMPSEAADAITLTLTIDQYVVDLGGAMDKGTYTVDLSAKPNRMTIMGTDGPNKGKTMLSIFDAPDAQTMRLCYDLEGKEFPQVFESTPENKFFLVTYVRQ